MNIGNINNENMQSFQIKIPGCTESKAQSIGAFLRSSYILNKSTLKCCAISGSITTNINMQQLTNATAFGCNDTIYDLFIRLNDLDFTPLENIISSWTTAVIPLENQYGQDVVNLNSKVGRAILSKVTDNLYKVEISSMSADRTDPKRVSSDMLGDALRDSSDTVIIQSYKEISVNLNLYFLLGTQYRTVDFLKDYMHRLNIDALTFPVICGPDAAIGYTTLGDQEDTVLDFHLDPKLDIKDFKSVCLTALNEVTKSLE